MQPIQSMLAILCLPMACLVQGGLNSMQKKVLEGGSIQHRHNCDLKCAPTNPHITSLTLMRMYHMLIEITRRTTLDAKSGAVLQYFLLP